MSQAHGQDICKKRWARLVKRALEEIDAIDSATPWSNTPPKWWLEMADIRRDFQNLVDKSDEAA